MEKEKTIDPQVESDRRPIWRIGTVVSKVYKYL